MNACPAAWQGQANERPPGVLPAKLKAKLNLDASGLLTLISPPVKTAILSRFRILP